MAGSPKKDSKKPRVLVVEDDPVACKALMLLLGHYGFDVHVSETLADALRQLDDEPEYVLLDLALPDGDGTKLLERVRERNLPIEVVVISGISDAERVRRVERLRPAKFLKKPVDLFQLLEGMHHTGDREPQAARK